MNIRLYSPRDIDKIEDIIFSYRRSLFPYYDELNRAKIRTCLQEAHASSQTNIWIAESNGNPIGYIAVHYIVFPMLSGSELYISDMIVAEPYRKQGVGKALIAQAETVARNKGCTRLMLNNSKDGDAYNKLFFKSNGYEERDGFANFVKVLTI